MVLLHGVLEVHVIEAKNLPASVVNVAGGVVKRALCCNSGPTLVGSCDPYLCLDVGKTRRLRSTIIQSTFNPVWDERAEVYVADEADTLKIEIKDADLVGAQELGQAFIPVDRIAGSQAFDGWLPLTDATGKVVGNTDKSTRKFVQARVHITIRYRPVGEQGEGGRPSNEVPRTYFPLRGGNKVTLYHDAVCTPGPVQGVTLGNGSLYSEGSCWDDIYDAIREAQRFIWITGWSVWDKTRLRRQPDRDETSPTLGELLIEKAKEGVNVLLLVWDDTTNNLGLHEGLMATHDQETFSFFKDTPVHCVLCPRQGGDEDSYLQKFSTGNMFTHHQKTVILDASAESMFEAPADTAADDDAATLGNLGTPRAARAARHKKEGGPPRRVVSFIGGLDLCDGRYDRPDHPMFETCGPQGVHYEDFHQACVDQFDAGKACPREPWHDIHAKVEGPVAMDIALNFMERWAKQAGSRNQSKMKHLDDYHDLHLPAGFEALTAKGGKRNALRHLSMKMEALKTTDTTLCMKHLPEPEAWSVQLFRSIDSDSAEGFPKSAEGSYEAGLGVGKGKSIDASIHRAYIHLIRSAKRYLYLENQYFLGSAHLWDSDTDTPCYNQVPAEIALKIVSKIKAGEPFRVYIVTPMYPEGIPTSASVQAILHFETQTRRMMYKRVADAIAEAGLQAHPQDYLQFFCLGKREGRETSEGLAKRNIELKHDSLTVAASLTPAPADADDDIAAQLPPDGHTPLALPDPSTCQGKAQAARRFMIYVHSKLMIVDDEYVVVGSANINQRSLDGSRDSEICIGAFQDGHVMASAADPLPHGQVAGFRKALWMEHLGHLGPEHEDPSSLECARSLVQIGDANWLAYHSIDVHPLPRGHLLSYPNVVGGDGSITPLPDCDEVPDLGGKILGTKSMVLPGLLTA